MFIIEEEAEIEVQIAIPKKNKWDDEDVEDDVKDSWEDLDEEKKEEPKKVAAPVKKKVPLKQKIAEKQAREEQKKKELEAKKLAEEEEAEEDEYARKQRMRQLELEADMMSATELFSGVSIGKSSILIQYIIWALIHALKQIEDMKGKPIEEWKPKNRVELDAFRKRIVEIISANSVSCICIIAYEVFMSLWIEIHQLWLDDWWITTWHRCSFERYWS